MPNKTLEKWEEKTIDEIAYIKGGKRLPKGEKLTVEKTTHPYIRVTDFNDLGTIDIGNVQFITDSIYEQIKNYTITSKDLYISIAGTIGKTGIIPKELDGANLTENACKLVYKNNEIFNKYVYYYTLTRMFTDQILDKTKMTAMPKLALTRLATVKLPVPSLLEQQRIVGILDKAFKNIEKAKQNALQNLNNAKELFESYLNNILKYLENIGEFKQLSTITEVKDGTHDSPKYVKVGIPFITQKNIKEGGFNYITDDTKYITEEDHNKFYQRSNVKKNDILISMIGANRGMACIVDIDEIFSIKNVGLIKDSTNIDKYYLLYYLKSNYAKQYIAEKSKGGAQEFVGLTALRAFPILYVDVNEQQKIVAQLDELQEQTKKLEQIYEQKIKDLDELKQSILQKAFNGEL